MDGDRSIPPNGGHGGGGEGAPMSNGPVEEDNGSTRSGKSSRSNRSSRSKTKSKKRPIEPEETATAAEVIDVDEDEAASQPPKKKRTRLTSPEPTKKQAAAEQNGDDDDDDDDDEVMADQQPDDTSTKRQGQSTAAAKMPAGASAVANANVAHAQSTAADSTKPEAKKPPAKVPNLKLKSQQTPGKFDPKQTAARASTSNNNNDNSSSNELRLPSRKLVFNEATPAAAAAPLGTQPSANTSFQNASRQANQARPFGNGPSSFQHAFPPQQYQQQRPAQQAGILSYSFVWFLLFLILHVALSNAGDGNSFLPSLPSLSDRLLHFYKSNLYKFDILTPPIRTVPNRTRVAEIKQLEKRRQQKKRKMLKDLEEVQLNMEREIQGMEDDGETINKDLDTIHEKVKEHYNPVSEVHDKLSRIEELLKDLEEGNDPDDEDGEKRDEAMAEIMDLLGESDRNKLLDLSSLDLWEIAEIPEDCGGDDGDVDDEEEEIDEEEDESDDDDDDTDDEDVEELEDEEEEDPMLADDDDEDALVLAVVDQDQLDEWEDSLRKMVEVSAADAMEEAEEVKEWILSELKTETDWKTVVAGFEEEELDKLIEKQEKPKRTTGKKHSKRSGGNSLPEEAILRMIQDRLELEIADQTGQVDYAAIHNGASVIRRGPRFTSPSLRRNLPYLNRVMANLGLKFYGYDAEAALTPTVPRDALGQCWSFQSEEATARKRRKPKSAQDFSRGTVATLTVRLAKPIYVDSIVIEHPPKEITDRLDTAIRIFRVVGYEDTIGKRGSYELGRFEYRIDDEDGPMTEFEVRKRLTRQDVPKLRSIALAIDSTWGGGNSDYGCLYRFRVHGSESRDDNA